MISKIIVKFSLFFALLSLILISPASVLADWFLDLDVAPLPGQVYINGTNCENGGCNNKDIIVHFDSNDNNKKIPFTVTFFDSDPPVGEANYLSDIKQAYIIFNTTASLTNSPYYVVQYYDNGYGSRTVLEHTGSGTHRNSLSIESTSSTYNSVSGILTIGFVLDVSGLANASSNSGGPFLSNIYLMAEDTWGKQSEVEIKVGSGSFTRANGLNSPYESPQINALDIWNGQDVFIPRVRYYPVRDYTQVCSQVNLPTAISNNLVASYLPDNLHNYTASLNDWNVTGYFQPYYYFSGEQTSEVEYQRANNNTYLLMGGSARAYGNNSCVKESNGKVLLRYLNGGVRNEDGTIGDRSLDIAFAVAERSGSWSQTLGGNFFTNSSLVVDIEPLFCNTCYFTNKGKALVNGLTVANGNIDSRVDTVYGSPNNWFAQIQNNHKPLKYFRVDKNYEELKNLYKNNSLFTELSGSQTVGVGSLQTISLNHTYFINGDLIINSNNLLTTPEGSYLLFIVRGNITITDSVKNSAAASGVPIQAILVALGNITVQDDPVDTNDDLTIEGALVASGSIDFERSLGENNNSRPSVIISFREDMLGRMADDEVGIISLQKNLVSQ